MKLIGFNRISNPRLFKSLSVLADSYSEKAAERKGFVHQLLSRRSNAIRQNAVYGLTVTAMQVEGVLRCLIRCHASKAEGDPRDLSCILTKEGHFVHAPKFKRVPDHGFSHGSL